MQSKIIRESYNFNINGDPTPGTVALDEKNKDVPLFGEIPCSGKTRNVKCETKILLTPDDIKNSEMEGRLKCMCCEIKGRDERKPLSNGHILCC